jgi:DNA-binding IclR family transcriptional regulator
VGPAAIVKLGVRAAAGLRVGAAARHHQPSFSERGGDSAAMGIAPERLLVLLHQIKTERKVRLWTDDYSNLFQILR